VSQTACANVFLVGVLLLTFDVCRLDRADFMLVFRHNGCGDGNSSSDEQSDAKPICIKTHWSMIFNQTLAHVVEIRRLQKVSTRATAQSRLHGAVLDFTLAGLGTNK